MFAVQDDLKYHRAFCFVRKPSTSVEIEASPLFQRYANLGQWQVEGGVVPCQTQYVTRPASEADSEDSYRLESDFAIR